MDFIRKKCSVHLVKNSEIEIHFKSWFTAIVKFSCLLQMLMQKTLCRFTGERAIQFLWSNLFLFVFIICYPIGWLVIL